MSATLLFFSVGWGLFAGYVLLRCMDSLLGLIFCVHGLFERRWKKLADKNATDLVRSAVILKLALRLGFYVLLCVFLLKVGDGLFRQDYHLQYAGFSGLLFSIAGGSVILSRLMTSWQRLKLVWRITHEFDFAARRERTRLLKS